MKKELELCLANGLFLRMPIKKVEITHCFWCGSNESRSSVHPFHKIKLCYSDVLKVLQLMINIAAIVLKTLINTNNLL